MGQLISAFKIAVLLIFVLLISVLLVFVLLAFVLLTIALVDSVSLGDRRRLAVSPSGFCASCLSRRSRLQ